MSVLKAYSQEASSETSRIGKYLKILLKRPAPGYVFDKFYDSWLEFRSSDKLAIFLYKQYRKSKNYAFLLLLAFYYEKEGHFERALDLYDQITEKRPNDVDVYYYKARISYYENALDQAIKALTIALKHNPDHKLLIKIKKLLGRAHIRKGNYEKGLAIWKKLAKAENDLDLKEEILSFQIEEELFEAATENCRELINETDRKYHKVMLMLRLGSIYMYRGKEKQALQVYRNTLNNVGVGNWLEKEILTRIEKIFRDNEDMTGLVDYYQKLYKQQCRRTEVLKRYARILYETGDTEKALRVFKNLVELTPLNRENREQYSVFLEEVGDFKNSLEVLNELIKTYPNDAELRLRKASLENRIGNSKSCIQALQEYIKQSGNTEFAYIRAGRWLVNNGLPEEAGKIYDILTRKYPDSFDAREISATFWYSNGQKKKALKEFIRLSETDNINSLLRIVKTLVSLKEYRIAYALLLKRKSDFKDEYIYYEWLYSVSNLLKQRKKAREAAVRMVETAGNFNQLVKAIADTIYILKKLNKQHSVIRLLKGKKKLSVNYACLLAELFEDIGQVDDVDRVLKNAQKNHPDSEILTLQQLRIYKHRYQWDRAIAVLKKMIKKWPRRKVQCLKELVSVCQKAEKYDEALKWLGVWKQTAPGSVTPYLLECSILQYKDLGKAIRLLKQAKHKFSDNKSIMRMLAQLHILNDDYNSAERLYWNMLDKTTSIHAKLGYVNELISIAVMRKDMNGLLKKLKKKISSDKKENLFPYLALAEIYKQKGNLRSQRKYLSKAAEIKKHDISLLHKIARIDEDEGDYEQALSILRNAESLDKTGRTSRKIAQFYFRHGDEDKGFKKLEALSDYDNLLPGSVEEIAISLINVSLPERAVNFLEPFIRKYKDNYRLKYLYALAMEYMGDNDRAVEAFLNVLSAKVEVRKAKFSPLGSTAMSAFYKEMYNAGFPPEAIEILKLKNISQQIYQYGNSSTISPVYGSTLLSGRAMSRGNFPIPGSLAEVQLYVLPHLSKISRSFTMRECDELVKRLVSLGIAYADIKLELGVNSEQSNDFWYKFHKKYPDDELITTIWGLSLINGSNNKKQLEEAYHALKGNHPRIALNVILNSMERVYPVFSEKRIRELVKIFNNLKKSNPSVFIYRLCHYVVHRGDRISPKLKQYLIDESLKIYFNKMPTVVKLENYFPLLCYVLLKEHDYKQVVKVLSFEAGKPVQNVVNPTLSSYRRQGKMFQPLSFPPESLSNLPASVISFFRMLNGERFLPGVQALSLVNLDDFWDAASKVSSNELKLLLVGYCGEEQEGEKIVEHITTSRKDNFSALMTAAAYMGRMKEYSTAVKILEEAVKHTGNRATLKRLNGAIIAYAERVGNNDDQVRKSAAQAAIRLLNLRLSQREKLRLIELLSFLGLNKEADKVNKMIVRKMSRHSSQPQVAPVFSGKRVESYKELDRIYNTGNTGKACKYAVKEFRKLIKPVLIPRIQVSAAARNLTDLNHLINVIKRHNGTDDLLNVLKPSGPNPLLGNIIDYAFGCELFDRRETAVHEYKAILKSKPNNRIANLRLALLLAGEDNVAAVNHLKKALERQPASLIISLLRMIADKRDPKEKLLLISLLLEISSEKPQLASRWLLDLFFQLESQLYYKGIRVSHLFDQRANMPLKGVTKKTGDIIKLRRRLYLQLCDISMKIPEFSEMAFTRKLKLMEMQGKVDDDIYNDAINVLLLLQDKQFRNVMERPVYVHGKKIPLKSPEEFLISRFFKDKDEKRFRKFISRLPKDSDISKYLKSISDMRKSSNKEFAERASAFINHGWGERVNTFPQAEIDKRVNMIIQVWSSRDSVNNLNRLISDIVTKVLENDSIHLHMYHFPVKWAVILSANSNDADITDYLEGLTRVLFSHYLETIKGKADPSFSKRRLFQSKIQLLQSVMNALVNRNENMVVPILHLFSREEFKPLVKSLGILNSFCRRYMQKFQRVGGNLEDLVVLYEFLQYSEQPQHLIDSLDNRFRDVFRKTIDSRMSQYRNRNDRHYLALKDTVLNWNNAFYKLYPASISPIVWNSLKNMTREDLRRILTDFNAVKNKSMLLKEADAVVRYELALRNDPQGKAPQQFVDFYKNLFNNEQILPNTRLNVYFVNSGIFSEQTELSEIAVSAARLMARINRSLPDPAIYNRLPLVLSGLTHCHVSEEWKKAVYRLLHFWNIFHWRNPQLKSANRNFRKQVLDVFTIYNKLGDENKIQEMLTDHKFKLAAFPEIYIILLNFQRLKFCGELLKKNWTIISFENVLNSYCLTEKTRKSATVVIQNISRSELSFFAKVFFATFRIGSKSPIIKGIYSSQLTVQREELIKLADALTKIKFKNILIKQKCEDFLKVNKIKPTPLLRSHDKNENTGKTGDKR